LRKYEVPFTVMDNSRYQSRHVRPVLSYFRLILDNYLDDEMEQLLQYCVTPYFQHKQIKRLKKIAQASGGPLFNTLNDDEILNQIDVSPEQQAALWQHLQIIQNYETKSRFADVWQAINALPNGPLSSDAIDEEQLQELEGVFNMFRDCTVAQSIKDINSHISYLDEHSTDQQLVVTTIDHAKSQAFDTVFLLGAQELSPRNPKRRARLYVSISRARQRFFFLIDKRSDEAKGDDALLPWLQKELHDKLSWL
jgi:superfamily I DNA/RNA helicase